ncbi:MAG: STAS domain-containing protein [Atopobiaceae bacterium]|jgi:anti-sigma B factor antagonist|nr:STAS domain-containing protein [Atopobiaceae bacterium]
MELSVNSSRTGSACRLAVTGEVDVSNASRLREALDAALGSKPSTIEVDLAEVPYIDSTGIGVLVGSAHRASEQDSGFEVVSPQKNVSRVLTLLGVGDELHVKA